MQWFAFVSLVLMPGVAQADFFIFNATTNPTSGVYIPVDGGHYNHTIGAAEYFFNAPGGFGAAPSDQVGVFFYSQAYVDPNCPLDPEAFCPLNDVLYFTTPDGLALNAGSEPAMAIYDQGGDPLALMIVACGPSATCEMAFLSGNNGAPIDLNAELPYIGRLFATSPRIITAGGTIQHAFDGHFRNGNVDSFECSTGSRTPFAASPRRHCFRSGADEDK